MAVNFQKWLSLREAHIRSGYSISHIRKLANNGKLTVIRKGRMLFVSVESLDAYVEKMKRLGTEKHNWRRQGD